MQRPRFGVKPMLMMIYMVQSMMIQEEMIMMMKLHMPKSNVIQEPRRRITRRTRLYQIIPEEGELFQLQTTQKLEI